MEPVPLPRGGRPRYIVIEGPIGVGKTTLVNLLARRLACRTALEQFEENPFLSEFYRDRARYAFQTEMFFLLTRFRQMESVAQADLFSPYTIGDYLFEKSLLFARETLDDHEFRLFDHLFGILQRSVPQPDLVFHLTAPLDVLLDRIRRRGRPYERDMDPQYLGRLAATYERHFAHMRGTPLVTVDTTDIDFLGSPSAIDGIVRAIHEPPADRLVLRGPVQSELFPRTPADAPDLR